MPCQDFAMTALRVCESAGATEVTNAERVVTPRAPVARGERIVALDVLRGFALLGILVLNIEDFSGPESLHDIPVGVAKAAFVGWHAHLDIAILTLKWMFFEGKMRALFATLFGAGCVLLTERIERRAPEAAADIFLRRSMWLVLFGLIHGTLIWAGDILFDYSLNALLFLYPLRHVAAKKLIVVGLAIALLGGTLGIANFSYEPSAIHDSQLQEQAIAATHAGRPLTAEQKAAVASAVAREAKDRAEVADRVALAHKGYLAVLSEQVNGFFGFTLALIRTGWMAEVTGMLIFGMGLYKTGFLSGRRSPRLYATTIAIGYGMSVPIVLVGVHQASLEGFSNAAAVKWMYIPYGLQQIPAMIANASVLLLIVSKGWLRPLQRVLGAVGRTAFTNYIGTSLLCQFIFTWGPWHLYGTLEYYQQIYVIAGVWMLNIVASMLWLRVFAYGPLEWAWRSLTYWKLQPFRLSSAPAL
jgi:uncharacterized protein